MLDKIGKAAHFSGRKPIDGDSGVRHFAGQNAEYRCSVMLRKERGAARVDIKRTPVLVPEVIAEEPPVAVSGEMWP